jgi:hypothetical protein
MPDLFLPQMSFRAMTREVAPSLQPTLKPVIRFSVFCFL